ncbi:MAG: hypothetical protein AAB612_03305 [Patescibacteria group bacterium]
MNSHMKLCIVLVIFTASLLAHAPKVQANLSSNSYIIQYNNLNMTSGKKTSGSYTLTDTNGQTASGKYGTTGYIVRSGFQYIYSIGTFSFVISNTSIDFGTLSPNVFATATTSIAVSAKGAGGYTVTAFENYPLKKVGTSTTIPNTSCNSSSCTYGTAAVWTDATKAGFGYNMTGSDYPSGFVDSTYFKPFADLSQSQPAQTIMSNSGVVKKQQGIVTYKIAVSGNQAAGQYENHIIYIATPGY